MSRKSKSRAEFSAGKAARRALGDRGFVGHIPALLMSAAWRARSISLVRLLDRLEVEHIAHAGRENGFLRVTYNQFVEYGIGRRFIRGAIEEGEQLGLLKVTATGFYTGPMPGEPSTYQLLYLHWKFVPATGPPQYLQPAHDWQHFAGGKPKPGPRSRHKNVLRLVPKN